MTLNLEALLRLQQGWQEPAPLPVQTEGIPLETLHMYRDQAALVLAEVYSVSEETSDGETPAAKLAKYLDSLQAHFGNSVRQVAAFHGLSGSTLDTDESVTHADFPDGFAFFGTRGFWETIMLPAYPALASFSFELLEAASQKPASLQTGSEVQWVPSFQS